VRVHDVVGSVRVCRMIEAVQALARPVTTAARG